jgi:hypothetical protein
MTGPAIPARYGMRETMPLESFLDRTAKIDLDDLAEQLEGTPAVAKELSRSREQVAALAAKLMDSEYRPVVEWLIDISLRRPTFMPGLGHEGQLYAAYREGGNAVVWQLIQAIAQGREEMPPQREGA